MMITGSFGPGWALVRLSCTESLGRMRDAVCLVPSADCFGPTDSGETVPHINPNPHFLQVSSSELHAYRSVTRAHKKTAVVGANHDGLSLRVAPLTRALILTR